MRNRDTVIGIRPALRGSLPRAGIGFLLWLLVSAVLPLQAHVNSPYIVFEGRAGNVPIQVVIRQPEVVPGLAGISIRVLQGSPTGVQVLPLHWNVDRTGAPRPDVADPVAGETNLYSAALWLMTRGAYGIEVEVLGPGGGTALVPVDSIAHVRKPMTAQLGWILALLGAGLAVGVIAIATAAAREATLPSGVQPGPGRWRMAIIAGTTATLVVAGMVGGGRLWWNLEDRQHDTKMLYRQFEHEVVRQSGPGGDGIRLQLTDRRRRQPANRLVADHGQLVHLFLIGGSADAGIPAFAHVHPQETGDETSTFVAPLPSLPAGRYRTFAELSLAGGTTQTLTNTLTLTEASSTTAMGPDYASSPSVRAGDRSVPIGDGLAVRLETGSLRAGEPVALKAVVTRSDGSPAALQPYLRMLGHAAVMRDDGSVFAHLHPAGSLSMASARLFATKLGGEAGARAIDVNCGDLDAVPPAVAAELGRSGVVGFPFVFPESGRYFVWVQIRVDGHVRTAPFEVHVSPPTPQT